MIICCDVGLNSALWAQVDQMRLLTCWDTNNITKAIAMRSINFDAAALHI